ncbi:hypothetical protein CCACVL1_18570 [Corchorus capsularis]|uniref:RRM domain-containing protein n=1 Tax=Corchorus capsularis TaxID=210143 RepID=A0A1R3HKR3_COCAP|nr:hypothetical protein CCACVL1_18570 [Corchorus capsularis]
MASAPPPPQPLSRPSTQMRPPPQLVATVAGGNPLHKVSVSLYVGDLDPDVTENDLFKEFSAVAPVVSLRLCRCTSTGKSLRYGYVNFVSHSDASKALACLNHSKLKGKPMRIMWSHRDPSPRKSGLGNVFVKNLDPSITCTDLEEIFCRFGTILSCKVAEENGMSKGFGFVQFDSEESAKIAISTLHDTVLKGMKLYVSKFVKKSERTAVAEEAKFTNLYVKNLVDGVTEDHLQEMFSKYGKVCSAIVMKDGKGSSRGFGFVSFQSPDDAKKALDAMNGVQLGSMNLFVGRAQKKAERTELLKHKYSDMFNCRFEKYKDSNLYVKNLNLSVDDKRLHELFCQFGKITSAKVMCHDNGISKGFGFVCFSTPLEAMEALHRLNGIFFEGKNLYVAVAQRKEDRLLKLQHYHVENTLVQSSYQPSYNAITPQFHPFYFNFPPCPPLHPLLRHPSLYQPCIPNAGLRYPYATTHDRRTFSHDATRHMHPCNAGIRRDWACRQSELDHGNNGSKKAGFRKKNNRKGATAANSSAATVAAIQPFKPATSPGNSKKSNENLTPPLAENLQPGTVSKVTGVLLEMNNSDVNVIKLLNTPHSLVEQDKPVQGLNDANVRASRDAVTFANPKTTARCLSY